MRPETVPMLVVALLLVSLQPGVQSVTTVVGGAQTIEAPGDALIVVDGTVTVPEDTEQALSVYVLDGTANIDGTLDGDIVQLAGQVTLGSQARITGTYQALGGSRTVAEGAAVTVETVAEPLTRAQSFPERLGLFALQALGLAAVGFLAGRRAPDLFATVSHAVVHHPVVSGTVGLLATVTLLALFVFMAFTLLLLPVSLLGFAGGAVVVLYAYVSVGYLVGQRLPTGDTGVATAAGSVLFLLASDLLGLIPLVGALVPVAVLLVGIGAVFITYFGLRQFEPPRLRAVE